MTAAVPAGGSPTGSGSANGARASVADLSRRARAFALTAALAVSLVTLAAVALVWREARRDVANVAEARRRHFEQIMERAAGSLAAGERFGRVASRYSLANDGQILTASPAWLTGLDAGRNDTVRRALALAPGEYLLLLAPDLADMRRRVLFALRTPSGVELMTFAPRELLVPTLPDDAEHVIDGGRVVVYSTHPEREGERLGEGILELAGGRLWIRAEEALSAGGGLHLVVEQDVTSEAAWVVGASLLCLLVSGWLWGRAGPLQRDLTRLESESRDIERVLRALSRVSSTPGSGGDAERLSELLAGPLAEARGLEPSFAEPRMTRDQLLRFGEQLREAVAARERQAQATRESEERLRRALAEAPLPAILHTQDGEVLLVNRVWTELTGYTHEQLPTIEAWTRLAYGDDQPRVVAGIARLFEGDGGRVDEGEFRIRTERGAERVWLFSSSGLGTLPDGRRLVISMAVDVTERQELEASVRHAETMRAIGQLAGGVAHDFNNQLTAILGYAELLAADAVTEEQRENAGFVLAAARRSAALTQQLLAFARKGPRVVEPVDLNALLGEVEGLLRRSVDPRIHLVLELAAGLPPLEGDAAQLQSALLNLGVNARDAMPRGGTLRFASALVEDEGGRVAVLEVSDTGSGIPPEVQARMFEPFFTTKPTGRGTGMGLPAVLGTVEAHGGRLEVESAVGVGTTFRLRFPLGVPSASLEAAPGPETAAPVPVADARAVTVVSGAARMAAPAATSGPSAVTESDGAAAALEVLVVDDEPAVRNLTCASLRVLGHRARGAATRDEALAAARSEPPVDVVLLDLFLSAGERGDDVVAELRAARPEAAIVLCTGAGQDPRVEAALQGGARALLTKPYLLEDLRAVLVEVAPR